jgi:hypothetical protein
MKAIVYCLMAVLCLVNNVYSQNCKCLLSGLSESYEGDCKGSKAHGKGKAKGVDSYEGDFKNGLPDGKGKYAWGNGYWYEGGFKEGKKSGDGVLHMPSVSNQDSAITGYWSKDLYVGLYEATFKVQSKGYNVKNLTVTQESKQEPHQIIIDLSSVMGGSEDMHGTIPKPVLVGIDIKKGSYMNKSEVTSMTARNMYYLTGIIFPFSASFLVNGDEVVIDFNNSASYKVAIVMRQ